MPWSKLAAVRGGMLLGAALLVNLTPAPALAAPAAPAASAPDGSSRRLTLTFVGLGASASAGALTAWMLREDYVRRWNSDRCLRPGVSRGDVCGDLLASGRNAERVALMTSMGAALFLGAALTSWLLEPATAARESATATGCRIGPVGAACFGSF